VLEKLLHALMRTAIEQAGAQRGVLVVWRDGELRCVAAGSVRNDTITVELRDDPVAQTLLSQSIAQYVLRTRDPVILDDATAEHPFSADSYIRQRQARSVLCLPLITQAKLGGLLYL
jgi:GAF domain-containing protein